MSKKIVVSLVFILSLAAVTLACPGKPACKMSSCKMTESAKQECAKKAPVAQTICPVMGGKIDSTVFTVHESDTVYFCCAMCINTFKKDPDSYIKKMAEEVPAPACDTHKKK